MNDDNQEQLRYDIASNITKTTYLTRVFPSASHEKITMDMALFFSLVLFHIRANYLT